jgi:hypothetical protein
MGIQAMNIYQFMKGVTDSLLETNISTTGTDSITLQLVANANEHLTYGWLTDQKNEPNPKFNPKLAPNTTDNMPYLNPVYNALYVDVLYPMGSKNPYPASFSVIPYSGPAATAGSLFSAFTKFFNGTFTEAKNQDDLSDALIIQVSSILGNSLVWPKAGDKTNSPIASGFLTEITSIKSTIDSLSQEEEQTGKTDSNMEQSVISLDGNNPQNYTSIFTSEMEGMDVINSILQQGV